MLVNIGDPKEPEDAVGLLLACHARIRRFLKQATTLATLDLDHPEVADVAERVRRYFAEALPLHVRDEEESLVPRLSGRTAQVDAALAKMATEHEGDAALLAQLVSLCAEVAQAPKKLDAHRQALAETTSALTMRFTRHLESEETVLFPELAKLPAEALTQLRDEMRARRAPKETP